MSQGRDSNVGGIFILPVELRVCLRKTKRKKKETGRAATLCTSFDRCVVVATEIAPFQKPPPPASGVERGQCFPASHVPKTRSRNQTVGFGCPVIRVPRCAPLVLPTKEREGGISTGPSVVR